MDELLVVLAIIIYSALTLILVGFTVNSLYLGFLARHRRGPDPPLPALSDLPVVTVQLPIYNERYVAERLIDATAQLDWPRDRLEIQVLDDSTDETREMVKAAVERWHQKGVRIRVLSRSGREGFKAGALAAGMAVARGELLAYFDADFLPPRDFLRRTVPHFADLRVAFVQTRWGYLNEGYSLLTSLQALLLDAHFHLEQFGRHRGGYWFNFNGTAGVWRRAAIESAGGWRFDTLTEDLDLSYRAFLKGWKAVYLRDVVSPSELPVTVSAFARQQHRWARGGLECALKLLPAVWRSPAALSTKVQATCHVAGHCLHLTMFALLISYPLIIFVSQRVGSVLPLALGVMPVQAVLLTITAIGPQIFFTLAQWQRGGTWWRRVPGILVLVLLGCGMMAMTLQAASEIVRGRARVFERTPKFGITRRNDGWATRSYQLPLQALLVIESLIVVWAIVVVTYAWSGRLETRVWAIFPALMACGALFMMALTIIQRFQAHSAHRRDVSQPVRV